MEYTPSPPLGEDRTVASRPSAILKTALFSGPLERCTGKTSAAFIPLLLFRLGQCVKLRFLNIEVGVDVLDVVVVLKFFREPEHLFGLLPAQLHVGLRNHRDLRQSRLDAAGLQAF